MGVDYATVAEYSQLTPNETGNKMNAYATIEFLTNTTTNNGRKVRQAMVELSTQAGQWLGSFLVFGFNTEQLKESAYMQADSNATHKGYTLQSLREAA